MTSGVGAAGCLIASYGGSVRWLCPYDVSNGDPGRSARAHDLHRSLTARGIGVDVVHPSANLDPYDVIVVPTLYLVTDDDARSIAEAADRGASVVVTYFSGIVDEHDHVRLGGYPGAFRDLLGIRVEEFVPLRADEQVRLDDGSSADIWTEHLHLEGAEAIASYIDGPMAGVPAVTRRQAGGGTAWYVATRLEPSATDRVVDAVLDEAGIPCLLKRREPEEKGAEVTRRHGPDGRIWTVVVNHGDKIVSIPVGGVDLVTGLKAEEFVVAGGDVAVIQEG